MLAHPGSAKAAKRGGRSDPSSNSSSCSVRPRMEARLIQLRVRFHAGALAVRRRIKVRHLCQGEVDLISVYIVYLCQGEVDLRIYIVYLLFVSSRGRPQYIYYLFVLAVYRIYTFVRSQLYVI